LILLTFFILVFSLVAVLNIMMSWFGLEGDVKDFAVFIVGSAVVIIILVSYAKSKHRKRLLK